jgi:hypothetical protein
MHVSVGEKNDLGKALIVENGCSGEYASAFSNNTIHVASFSKSITTYQSFLAPSKKRLNNIILLLRQRNRE